MLPLLLLLLLGKPIVLLFLRQEAIENAVLVELELVLVCILLSEPLQKEAMVQWLLSGNVRIQADVPPEDRDIDLSRLLVALRDLQLSPRVR